MGYKIIFINQLKGKNDFKLLYKNIYKMGYSRLLIESGLTFLNSLLKNKIIHELYILKSSKKLGNYGKNNNSIKYLKNISPILTATKLNGDSLLKKSFKYV